MAAIRRIISVPVAALLAWAALNGCGDDHRFVGTWKGKANVVGQPGADPDILNSFAKIVVTIDRSGRFQLRLDTLDLSGSVEFNGENAVLHPELIMKAPLDRQPPGLRDLAKNATLIPNADGTLKFQIVGRDPVTLRRETGESQPPP